MYLSDRFSICPFSFARPAASLASHTFHFTNQATFSGCGLQLSSRWGCNSRHAIITKCNSLLRGNSTKSRSIPSHVVDIRNERDMSDLLRVRRQIRLEGMGHAPNEATCPPPQNFPPREQSKFKIHGYNIQLIIVSAQ